MKTAFVVFILTLTFHISVRADERVYHYKQVFKCEDTGRSAASGEGILIASGVLLGATRIGGFNPTLTPKITASIFYGGEISLEATHHSSGTLLKSDYIVIDGVETKNYTTGKSIFNLSLGPKGTDLSALTQKDIIFVEKLSDTKYKITGENLDSNFSCESQPQ